MRQLCMVIILISLCGCSTLSQRKIVTPVDYRYFRGNKYYDAKDFEKAIEYYQAFIEKQTNSELLPAAQLNLGMSHYYLANYKEAYETLSTVTVDDKSIKEYVDKITATCLAKSPEIQKAEQVAAKEEEAVKVQKGEIISIEITDAYLDNFDNVILSGKTTMAAKITTGRASAETNDTLTFNISTSSWKKGKPIVLSAIDVDGNHGKLEYFPDREEPDAPESLSEYSTGTNNVEIEWDENSESDIKGYRIYYRLQGSHINEVNELIKDTHYDIVGLQSLIDGANKTFEIYIRAIDKMNNESDDSDTLTVTLP